MNIVKTPSLFIFRVFIECSHKLHLKPGIEVLFGYSSPKKFSFSIKVTSNIIDDLQNYLLCKFTIYQILRNIMIYTIIIYFLNIKKHNKNSQSYFSSYNQYKKYRIIVKSIRL
ncbi:hypothetical protein EDEG_03371 [Edhazardia aedis USNM 41457]|uniref:Uncharacterized protein n=1 Tax=Edhazardia aedis (strain USNM 41457) TaxID=1003232 RepID=J9DHT2_EDHAE|nr:hypothetical protein EDEG_03371 [Edhazardia aedis USNM 41457]|eukprot:EJW02175.1 hypothetical protein EDEG_03371 [Edhazardia aedis USNM 41457]